MAYYGQAVQGQLEILSLRQDAQPLIEAVDTPPELRQQLMTATAIHQFAVHHLHLPDSGSYRQYADLGRSYSVWVVFATPANSLDPQTWCYPVVGCLSYQGFFQERAARAAAQELADSGLDTHVQGVAAYSTLGWFDDPLLNTFLAWPTPSLAHLLFHEMTHERLYVADDTDFNESYAEAVAQIGVHRWLEHTASGPDDTAYYADSLQAKAGFLQLVHGARQQLEALYRTPLSPPEQQTAKAELMTQISQRYQQEKSTWDREGRYEKWFSQGLNNAKLSSVHTYNRWVGAFLEILKQNHGNLVKFHQQVAALADLPRPQREARLREFTP